MSIGSGLQARRAELKLTQRDLELRLMALGSTIDRRQISAYENKRVAPHEPTIAVLAAALNTPTSYLFGEIDISDLDDLKRIIARSKRSAA